VNLQYKPNRNREEHTLRDRLLYLCLGFVTALEQPLFVAFQRFSVLLLRDGRCLGDRDREGPQLFDVAGTNVVLELGRSLGKCQVGGHVVIERR
jgi:hypothetical protein